MQPIDDLVRAKTKVDFHVRLYPQELAVIDGLANKFSCSRAAIIGAWTAIAEAEPVGKRVRPGRREGGGRKKQNLPV